MFQELTATLDDSEPSQLVVQAAWTPAGLLVRFADGCQCLAPTTDVLQGVEGQPTRAQVDSNGPLGVTLWFGKRSEFYPWDWLRGYGDAAYRLRMQVAQERGREVVAQRVREARRNARMTQQELAEAAGVGRATISRLEAGSGGVTLTTLQAITDSLGVSFVEVFGRQ